MLLVLDRRFISLSSRLAFLYQWLIERQVLMASELLSKLSAEGGCVDHLKMASLSLILLPLLHSIIRSRRWASHYFPTRNSKPSIDSWKKPRVSLPKDFHSCFTLWSCRSRNSLFPFNHRFDYVLDTVTWLSCWGMTFCLRSSLHLPSFPSRYLILWAFVWRSHCAWVMRNTLRLICNRRKCFFRAMVWVRML